MRLRMMRRSVVVVVGLVVAVVVSCVGGGDVDSAVGWLGWEAVAREKELGAAPSRRRRKRPVVVVVDENVGVWLVGGGDVGIVVVLMGWEEAVGEKERVVDPIREGRTTTLVVVVVDAAGAVVVARSSPQGVLFGCVLSVGESWGVLVGVVAVVVAADAGFVAGPVLGSRRRLEERKRRDGGSVGVPTSS